MSIKFADHVTISWFLFYNFECFVVEYKAISRLQFLSNTYMILTNFFSPIPRVFVIRFSACIDI